MMPPDGYVSINIGNCTRLRISPTVMLRLEFYFLTLVLYTRKESCKCSTYRFTRHPLRKQLERFLALMQREDAFEGLLCHPARTLSCGRTLSLQHVACSSVACT